MGIFGVDEQSIVSNVVAQLTPLIEQAKAQDHAPSGPISESAGVNRPANFVPVSQNPSAIITLNWHRMATIMQKLIMQTGMAKRLHSAIRNYVIGDGLEYSAKAKTDISKKYVKSAGEALTKFVTDPRNRLTQKLHDIVFEHSAFGETALPVKVDPVNGTVTITRLPSLWIEEVNLNPLDADEALSIKTRQGSWQKTKSKDGGRMNFQGEPVTLNVIRHQSERYCLDPKTLQPMKVKDEATGLETFALNKDYGTLAGQVFFFRSNVLNGSSRGWGDSVQVADLMQAFDQFLFDTMNRLDMQASVVWDLEVEGGDNDVKKWQNQPLPTGAQMFAHNKKVKLTPLAPAIKIEEFVSFIKLLRQIIAGAVGIPEYAMGYGGDTNVATAKEQAPVMNSEFNNRRTNWEDMLRFIFRFVLEQANNAQMLYNEDDKTSKVLTTDELDDIELAVNFKPFNASDLGETANTLVSIANALLIYLENDFISAEEARKAARQSLSPLGVNTSDEADVQTMKDEAEEEIQEGESGKTLDFTASESAKRKVKSKK